MEQRQRPETATRVSKEGSGDGGEERGSKQTREAEQSRQPKQSRGRKRHAHAAVLSSESGQKGEGRMGSPA